MSTSDVKEVSFEEALADDGEGGGGQLPMSAPEEDIATDQNAPATRPRPVSKSDTGEDDADILAPKVAARKWVLGDPNSVVKEYVQRELSVIGKTQWFSLVGEVLDKAMSGDNKLSLNSLLTPPERTPGQPLSPNDFRDADMFVHAVGKLMEYSPEFLSKSICIWLDVPDYEWSLVDTLMKRSPQIGGISDDDFEEILATFLDQNIISIIRFFRERFPRLRERWQARQKEITESRSRSSRR